MPLSNKFSLALGNGDISETESIELAKMSNEAQDAVFYWYSRFEMKQLEVDNLTAWKPGAIPPVEQWHPDIKLLRASKILGESHAVELSRLPPETQEHVAGLIMRKNPLPPPYNGKFTSVPVSITAPLKDKCARPDRNIVKYLLATYLYYEEDFSPITDDEYDCICQELLLDFDDITHWSRHLLDKESLKAGTGYHLFGKLPAALRTQAKLWRKELERSK